MKMREDGADDNKLQISVSRVVKATKENSSSISTNPNVVVNEEDGECDLLRDIGNIISSLCSDKKCFAPQVHSGGAEARSGDEVAA